MRNFLLVAYQVGVLFVLMGAGAACRKAKLVDEFSIRGIVNVLILVVTPCLIVDVFQRPFDGAMLAQFGLGFAIAFLAHAAVIAFASFAIRGDDGARPVAQLATVFSNAGFMGIPLEQAILGPEGVFYGIIYVAMFNLFMWSWGLKTMRGPSPGKGLSWRELRPMVVNPGTIGLAVGLPLFLLSVRLPGVVGRPVKMLSDLNTPLAMLVIGYYLAGADLRSVLRSRLAHTAAFVRMVAYPLVLLAALLPLKCLIDRTLALALVTAASAPVAAMVTMFAAKYRRDVDLSVGLVSGTTLLGMLTMPAVIGLAMNLL